MRGGPGGEDTSELTGASWRRAGAPCGGGGRGTPGAGERGCAARKGLMRGMGLPCGRMRVAGDGR